MDAAEHLIGFVVYGVLHGAMWGTQLRPGRKIRWKSMGKTEEIWCDSHDLGMEDFNALVSTLMK